MEKDQQIDFRMKEVALNKAIDINTERYHSAALSNQSGLGQKMNVERMLKDAETIYKWLQKPDPNN